MRKTKNNGFDRPFHILQIISWFATVFIVWASFTVLTSALEGNLKVKCS